MNVPASEAENARICALKESLLNLTTVYELIIERKTYIW